MLDLSWKFVMTFLTLFGRLRQQATKRDSPGHVMLQVVGQLLTEAGYTLWYWGYKNPYMAEYDAWHV